MASNASNRFDTKLKDVQGLLDIHQESSGIGRGRREAKLRVLHKASIALLVAAWETYIEALIEEGVAAISGVVISGTAPRIKYEELKDLIKGSIQQAVNRLNTANSDNILGLFRASFGIEDIRTFWGRPGMDCKKAYVALDQLLRERHSIVHGAIHDPEYRKRDVILWRQFLEINVRKTDIVVRKRVFELTGKYPW
jgi:RiboL-PSP-HEPN